MSRGRKPDSALVIIDMINALDFPGGAGLLRQALPAARRIARLKQRLASLQDKVPEIVDIRGPGFMNAVEFNDVSTKLPSADFANKVRLKALEKGLILLTCGVHGNVIRFLAPITIQDEVFAEALDILEAAMVEARAA